MGSNYFGEPNYMAAGHMNINERGGFLSSSAAASTSSSRKGKKNGSDKPKQPQRGLGVAQLEKIRIHSQLGSCAYLPSHHGTNNPYEAHMRLDESHSSSPSYNGFHGHMMGYPDLDRANATYGDSQSSNISRWHQGNAGYGGTQHYFVEPSMSTRSFFEQGSLNHKNKRELMDFMGSSAHNSESQDVDLELRL